MASLYIKPPGKDALQVPLFKRITSLGRAAGNDVVVDDPQIPETALTLTADGATWVVEALPGATLLFGGKKRRRQVLGIGQSFAVGETVIEIRPETAPVATSTPRTPARKDKRERIFALGTLHEFSRRLLGGYDLPRLLDALLDAIIEVTGADKGFLILIEDGELHIQSARNLDQQTIDDAVSRVSDSIIAKVVRDREPIIVSDAMRDEAFSASESVVNLKLCSVMCVPLLHKGDLMGLIYVGNDSIVDLFEPEDLEILTIFAAQASLILANALLVNDLTRETESLRRALEDKRFGEIIGACDAMRDVFRKIEKVAGTDISVLITGETGTGKELVAREIHRRSPRAEGPFVAINCGAIPETLLESELFGHVRGAFTGAVSNREGRFQAAHGGTLFLDEIGELPPQLQVKLLRAIQEKTVTRVGDVRAQSVDIRILAATNRDLKEEIRAGRFREDLYYRLNVITLHLPPLRERGDDVLVIARYLLETFAAEHGSKVRTFSPAALKAIRRYTWPGNIRQLENRLRKAVVLAEGSAVTPEDLDLDEGSFEALQPLQQALEAFKAEYINRALERNGGNRTKTARDLGVDPRTIFRHLERMNSDG